MSDPQTSPVLPSMQRVEGSSQISHIGHDATKNHLFVQFWRKPTPEEIAAAQNAPTKVPGPIYRYEGVSATDHALLASADSKGKHFGAHIKHRFPATKVAA